MNLKASLSRFRAIRRLGRCASALLLGIGIALLLLLACGLLDAWLAFEVGARRTLVTAALLLLAASLVGLLIRAWSLNWQTAAEEADKLIGEARNPASTALGITTGEDSALGRYLASLTREQATKRIAALKAGRILHWRGMLRAARLMLVPAVAVLALLLAMPDASRTILQRLTHPDEDLPPWSNLRFVVEPASPSVVYGGEVTVAVNLHHTEPLRHPVELWVRDSNSGEIQKLNCYRESETRYSKTLDSMVEPVSIAFACGRARSHWVPIELLLQPRVLAGDATITPPAHTGLQPVTISLDNDQLKVPEGAQVSLTLHSNRPLSASSMTCRYPTRPGEAEQVVVVNGTVPTPRSIRFEWMAGRDCDLEILIRDIRGTAAASPLKLKLISIPDRPPNVDLESPGPYLYATPSSTLTIRGTTDDEYGLADVRLVRTLRGFRDRSLHIARELQGREYDFNKEMKLPDIGVSPGEVIEIYVESSDHNPTLLGRNSSSVSRVLIISEEQYAEYIRAKTSLEQFNARYQLITGALDEAIQALEQLRKALEQDDPKAAEEALKRSREAHAKAFELLNKLADDFPAFETEKRLQELAREAAQDLRPNIQELRDFDPAGDKKENLEDLAKMIKRLGAHKQKQQKMEQDAELMAQAATLLEMAARFRKIYQTQESLTKRIGGIAEEIRKGINHNSRLLGSLADTQDENREALDDFAAELAKRLEKVDRPELESVKQAAREFLDALKEADPQSVMGLGADAGRNGNSTDAYAQAELARSMLEKLMNRPDEFAAACKGDADGFDFNIPDVGLAMQQLLEGLMKQNEGDQGQQQGNGQGGQPGFGQGGQGGGQGGHGFGFGGGGEPGFSMLDVPVVGPERLFLSPSDRAGAGGGESKTGGKRPVDLAHENSNWQPVDPVEASRHAPDPRSVPEAYRDAVKLYYSSDDR